MRLPVFQDRMKLHPDWFRTPYCSRRYFKNWLVNRKNQNSPMRPGAMPPGEVKKEIKKLGVGQQAEILRIGYDGNLDDIPILIEVLDITKEGFSGKIVNLERQILESSSEKLVYAKKGGGIIYFNYDEGDIHKISAPKDEELLKKERNPEALKQILSALEKDDHVIVAYFDKKHRATVNTEGTILDKSDEANEFTLQIEKVNRIELENKIAKNFNIINDLVIAIEIV
ncbi:MAG: hypothetical protein WAN36_13090 [Calditrichia bacterium]